MASASLANSVINLGALREDARSELRDVLDALPGKKSLVLDPKLSGPIGLVSEVSMLKEHGVDRFYHLNANSAALIEGNSVLYLTRPSMAHMKIIATHIHAHEAAAKKGGASGGNKKYHVIMVPRRTMICERILEEEGVLGDVTLGEWQVDLMPVEDDLLSLELPSLFRNTLLDGDRTPLFYVARSLVKLQSMYGIIPKIGGKGILSRTVHAMMARMRKELGEAAEPPPGSLPALTPEIDELFLLDRTVDLATPMMTQLTYEGIVDETFGIESSYIDLDASLVRGPVAGGAAPAGGSVKYPLNSNDKFYAEIRDMNFGALGPVLNAKARAIAASQKEKDNLKELSDIKAFVKRLPALGKEQQSLKIHTDLAEKILKSTRESSFGKLLETQHAMLAGAEYGVEYIEEAIAKQDSMWKVLRLCCLHSVCFNGMKGKSFDFLRREFLQAYGYEHLFTLHALEKVGLWVRSGDSKGDWKRLSRYFKLNVDDLEEGPTPNDMSYVFSGYAPLLVRIVATAATSGWKQVDDICRTHVPGPTFSATQAPASSASGAGSKGAGNEEKKRKVTLVYVVGGITFAEVAALRFLGSQEGIDRDFIIATTGMINGKTLLQSVAESVRKSVPTASGKHASEAGAAVAAAAAAGKK